MPRNRFLLLLFALTVFLLASPVMALLELRVTAKSAHAIAHGVTSALFAALLLSAAFTVVCNQATKRLVIAASTAAIGLRAANMWWENSQLDAANHILGILILGWIITAILKAVFAEQEVTFDTICASLCGFLLLGMLWAMVYSLAELWDPASFIYSFAATGETGTMRFGAERSIIALYYSYVTMTTLGYGDITPGSPVTRMLATVQAIMGQLYLVVLVARLVGLHIAHSQRPPA